MIFVLRLKITTNFAGIIACRVFIGLPEAAFYPGAIFLLSRWYTKKVGVGSFIPYIGTDDYQKELAFRSAFLYAGLLIANAFGTVRALCIYQQK